MRNAMITSVVLGIAAGLSTGLAQTSRPATMQATAGAATQAGTQAVSPAEVERLRRENAELKKANEALRMENEKLKKQWNDAVRNGTGGTSSTEKPVAATKAASAAAVAQDGPGLYRISAGPGGKFTTTVRAKSREDAISIGMKTVAQKAMDWDENVEIKELKVERVGP